MILIPYHVHENHWVAVSCYEINNEVTFYYADDLNCQQTEIIVKHRLSTANTDPVFHPIGSNWINCANYTYTPHSNECGPRTLMALTVMGLHTTPHPNMLLPFMHPNIAQICRSWVAKTIITSNFDPTPFLSTITTDPQSVPHHNSHTHPSSPANLIQWEPAIDFVSPPP